MRLMGEVCVELTYVTGATEVQAVQVEEFEEVAGGGGFVTLRCGCTAYCIQLQITTEATRLIECVVTVEERDLAAIDCLTVRILFWRFWLK